MSTRPSEPLLALLRQHIAQSGLNTAAVAEKLGMDRGALKRKLGGSDALTVDDFLGLAQLLKLDPGALPGADQEPARLGHPDGPGPLLRPEPPGDEDWTPDAYGTLSRQVLRVALALALDFSLLADTEQLYDSGIPEAVLRQNPRLIRLSFPAKYHPQNRFDFAEEGVSFRASFDKIYTCSVPWSAVRRVELDFPDEPAPAPAPEPEPETTPKGGAPFLRLVKE